MSDKKKQVENEVAEKDGIGGTGNKRDFLEKSGVNTWMRDALSKLLSNRPQDGVGFLAEYFRNIGEKSNRVHQAYEQLTLTDYYQPAFADNVETAYELLSMPIEPKTPIGLTGSAYRDLLSLICSNIPEVFYTKLLQKIGPRDEEVIHPNVFHSGVFSSFVLIDYLSEVKDLFKLLAVSCQNGDRVDYELANVLFQELQDALTISAKDPISILKAGSKLTNTAISESMIKILVASQSGCRQTMSKEEFISLAVNIYLKEVKPLK